MSDQQNSPAEYKLLQKKIEQVEKENKQLRSALIRISLDNIEWGHSVIAAHRRLKSIAAAALEKNRSKEG